MNGCSLCFKDMGNHLQDLMVVCNNATCHSDEDADLLRLAPYSPMLDPIETIWSHHLRE